MIPGQRPKPIVLAREWLGVLSPRSQMFIQTYGGDPLTPEFFREATKWAMFNMVESERFEILLWFTTQIPRAPKVYELPEELKAPKV